MRIKSHKSVYFTVLSVIAAVLLLCAGPAFALTPCDKGLLPSYAAPSFLPSEDSEIFKALVEKIRKDFDETKSFSTFNFAELIPPNIAEELVAAMNQRQAMRLQTGVVLTTDPLGVPFYTNFKDVTIEGSVGNAELMKVEAILTWFEKLITTVFPQLLLKEATSQLRVTKERGNGHSGLRVWHPDGSPINILIAFDGPGPDVSTEKECPPSQFVKTKKVTQGQAIVFAGADIEKINPEYFSCIHRSPNWHGKRFLMIMHFYSK